MGRFPNLGGNHGAGEQPSGVRARLGRFLTVARSVAGPRQLYHEEKAKGGIALTMFGGSSNVAPDSPNIFRQLNVGTDAVIPYLQEFSERIHKHGAALMCQITHLGRRGEPYAS